jgi:4a-hydroxytetrahydrobiopterin dehydratase
MNQWTTTEGKLCKTFQFKDFPEALAWMVKAGFVIEKSNHHPEWTNIYNKVEVKLCTHDAGNIVTNKDLELAALLDKI